MMQINMSIFGFVVTDKEFCEFLGEREAQAEATAACCWKVFGDDVEDAEASRFVGGSREVQNLHQAIKETK